MSLRSKVGLIFIFVITTGCTSSNNRVVLDSYPGFSCPSPNTIKYEAWGENGLSKSCVNSTGKFDGSFWTAESGQFFSRAYYKDGKESGTWEYVDKDGVITRKVMTKRS